ncbi:hypothetical protein COY27_04525, partial [Candidatus Woesearchaeota archaeon CG_4_10_14_0_2_um_filter_33_13]
MIAVFALSAIAMPEVTWVNPSEDLIVYGPQVQLVLNATVLDGGSGIETVFFCIWSGMGGCVQNVTASNLSATSWNATINTSEFISDGNKSIRVYANETNGDLNNTEQRIITVDTTPPGVTIDYPTNGLNTSGIQDINITALDGTTQTNVTLVNITNSTGDSVVLFTLSTGDSVVFTTTWATANGSFPDGTYNLTIIANDTAGNVNDSEIVTVTVDNTAPSVNMVNSSFNTTNATPSVTFNYTDALFATANCTLYVDDVADTSNSSTDNATNTELTTSALDDGSHTFGVSCTDGASNIGGSSDITV